MALSPIVVMVLAVIILHERVNIFKIFGVGLGVLGALVLLIYANRQDFG